MTDLQDYEYRANTKVVALSDLFQEFPEPELLRIQLSGRVRKKPLDVGSFAYFIRNRNECRNDDRGVKVVLDSFVESRRKLVVSFLDICSGQRDASVLMYYRCVGHFIDWLNTQGYRDTFQSEVHAQEAYRDYSAYLNSLVLHGKWKLISASNNQIVISRLLSALYPESSHHIIAGAVRIRRESGSAMANAAHVALYREVCLAIARQCSDFVLNNRQYPCVVSILDYEVVLFPSTVGAVGPFRTSAPIYQAAERRLSTVEEYFLACDNLGRKRPYRSDISVDLQIAQASFDRANENERHWHRNHLAALAARSYVFLFLLITGATPTEFSQFKYADALEVEKSPIKKELSAVKFRAGGKSTLYNIGRGDGLSLLKEYLKIREWILDGYSHERLFFTVPNAIKSIVHKNFPELSVSSAIKHFYRSISGVFLDPAVPILSPRKMRKHKSNTLHYARISPSTVAAALNHSEQVNLSAYSDATPEQQEAELGLFWSSIRHAAHMVRERSRNSVGEDIATAAGHCKAFNQPSSIDGSDGPIQPSCHTQYGCLYCEHYICHSDEEDLRKLLSLQYVINAVRSTAPDVGHAEVLYKELSIRVEFILDALGDRSVEIRKTIEVVRAEVFDCGVLTRFWENRLARYEQLGVVF